jgi:RNA polymerase sigma factor (sigma-70 family)
MQDADIVALYWQRDESALRETEKAYGSYLFHIAYRILSDREDSAESVNDTYWKAWNSIPPHRPAVLATYLGKITRQRSIDILRTRNRGKRRASEYTRSLSELGECLSGGNTTQQETDLHLLAEAIGAYLAALSPEARNTFVGRYYFLDSIQEVAAYYGMSKSKVTSLLYRTRMGLKAYLEQEGFSL